MLTTVIAADLGLSTTFLNFVLVLDMSGTECIADPR